MSVKHDHLASTAHHEAGHAIARFRQRLAIRSVTIEEDEESFGRASHNPPGEWFQPDIEVDRRTRNRIESEIICALAGPEAECRFMGNDDAPYGAGSQADLDVAALLACYVCGDDDEASAYMEWLRIRARNLVRSEWELVEVLAAALLDRKTLSGHQVRKVLRRVFEERREAWLARLESRS